ncbi:hypothetical protein [Tenacibaculum aiptasiae]|uniref:hypothetical protein n=1 Tax=Tenacibaculum aiptasiae TaxID=426481 RepID=UPI00232F5EF6|nr:hypothetical protein [Tenacibaculum aiptasiae]
MKNTFYILILSLGIISCTNPKQNLIRVKNDYKIDLTIIDSVRENLNGFWLMDLNTKNSNIETILCLQFYNNLSSWEHINYNKKLLNNYYETNSCEPIASLIKIKDSVRIVFIGLGGSDTTKIDFLSKTKLKINNRIYLKHKGYSILK